ncbi:hypothetical protein AGDE_17149 [Angomonas deanei]|nr:hypothetical protein AGDE_17149 [Angomonas deanei]|eukprot:EPY15358.1 hypothetical protein AGDE_17149 [Angomonas deanei]
MGDRTIETLKKYDKEGKEVFFPLFLKNHWMAGILWESELTVYDSAPCAHLHKLLCRTFERLWPSLRLTFAHSARQVRGSNDCGIFALIAFYATYLRVKVSVRDDLPKMVRSFSVFSAAPTDERRGRRHQNESYPPTWGGGRSRITRRDARALRPFCTTVQESEDGV